MLAQVNTLAEVCVPTTTARVACLAAHKGVINEKKINAASPTRIQKMYNCVLDFVLLCSRWRNNTHQKYNPYRKLEIQYN